MGAWVYVYLYTFHSQNLVVLFVAILSLSEFCATFSILDVGCCGISGTVCNNELACFEFCRNDTNEPKMRKYVNKEQWMGEKVENKNKSVTKRRHTKTTNN